MRDNSEKCKGSSLIEFTLCSIPLIFVIASMFQMGLAMWNYTSLEAVIKLATRIAATKGSDCAGLACATTVGTLTQFITTHGIGLNASNLNVKLTSASGTITCNPVSSCSSSTTAWPPTGGNSLNQPISISGQLTVNSGLWMFVPGRGGTQFAQLNLYAVSQQTITY